MFRSFLLLITFVVKYFFILKKLVLGVKQASLTLALLLPGDVRLLRLHLPPVPVGLRL